MPELQASEKLHAACDECRTRKLKCSGESPSCSRCGREKIQCVYSPQKQMGRPKKRRRDDTAPAEQQSAEAQQQVVTTTGSFSVPPMADFGYVSPPEFDDFPFSEFQGNSGLPDLHAPPTLENAYPGSTSHLDFGIDPMIDPSLWNALPTTASKHEVVLGFASGSASEPSQTGSAPCTCLSIMYLSLSNLQNLSSFAFPKAIVPLREAMNTASTILYCERCPKEPFSSIQNVQSLMALLYAVAERFHKILSEIDAEVSRLEAAGQKKPFRIGDNNPANQHLHTGLPDCPMGFDIELAARDWKALAKQALKTEVLGGGSNPKPFISLLGLVEDRQKRWHQDPSFQSKERARLFGMDVDCRADEKHSGCLRTIAQIRTTIDNMGWN